MLKLPGGLDAGSFLARHWQKQPLFIPGAIERLRPAVTRNELAWLATLDDVESRLVFTERTGDRLRYRAESGPFDPDDLAALPRRDWTLLVHDVEKHLPALRKLFELVPFVPDWRFDDLMVSFAAPGGGVGPHRDNYDVFLCQGIGQREWHVTQEDVAVDKAASDDLALTREFEGATYPAREGDVLYLPPGVAHWGTATRACLTYSIGMRAPQLSDLTTQLPDEEQSNPFYVDPDLAPGEVVPGYIDRRAVERALNLLHAGTDQFAAVALALGRYVTQTKDWITPEKPAAGDVELALENLSRGGALDVHGMARLAWDDSNVYVNGRSYILPSGSDDLMQEICRDRRLHGPLAGAPEREELAVWMLTAGAFEITGN